MKAENAIEVNDLTIGYPKNPPALKDVTFTVSEGESVALLGANGAGKSTLLLALVGVLAGSGRIVVGGVEVSQNAIASVRRMAQLVFQDPNDQLFMPLVKDDVAFGPLNFGVDRARLPELVERSLGAVGIAGFGDRNPFEMSAGERKRAAIATALACEPYILLLDEPTSGLDPKGRRELADVLNSLPATKLIATHDLKFAQETCASAIVLIGGEVATRRPLRDLLKDEDILERSGLM